MAKDPKSDSKAAEVAPKSNKKLIIIIAAAVLLAGGGVAAFFMMQPKASPHKEEKHVEPAKAPVFVTMETFTINLTPDPDEKYLQLDMTVQVASSEVAEAIKVQMPVVRDRVLKLLSSKTATEIGTMEGKKTLTDEIVEEIKKPFNEGEKPLEVSGVFFTSFVIQ